MKKLFYTDPLAAAYMCREFNLTFFNKNHHGLTLFISWTEIFEDVVDCQLGGSIEKQYLRDKYYVHTDNYGFFEPQVGDLLQVNDNFYLFCDEYKGKKYIYNAPSGDIDNEEVINQFPIIQRDGNQFFMPESE